MSVDKRKEMLTKKKIPIDSNEAHLPTPRYGQYLTSAHNHITQRTLETQRWVSETNEAKKLRLEKRKSST